jgi:hypothetical protein
VKSDLSPVPFPPSSSLPKSGRSAQDDGKGCLLAKVNALWEMRSASEEELSALMPSILDKAFKGEL